MEHRPYLDEASDLEVWAEAVVRRDRVDPSHVPLVGRIEVNVPDPGPGESRPYLDEASDIEVIAEALARSKRRL